jgi:hypothetical protein
LELAISTGCQAVPGMVTGWGYMVDIEREFALIAAEAIAGGTV